VRKRSTQGTHLSAPRSPAWAARGKWQRQGAGPKCAGLDPNALFYLISLFLSISIPFIFCIPILNSNSNFEFNANRVQT
jgi:hypothetical protein